MIDSPILCADTPIIIIAPWFLPPSRAESDSAVTKEKLYIFLGHCCSGKTTLVRAIPQGSTSAGFVVEILEEVTVTIGGVLRKLYNLANTQWSRSAVRIAIRRRYQEVFLLL